VSRGSLLLLLASTLSGCAIPRLPLETEVSSPFGLRRTGFFPSLHHGVDLRAPEGTPVRTMYPGRVRFAGWMTGYGNVIWIDHRGDLVTAYAHLSSIQVATGETVASGAIIGLSGSTGNVTGPHLHFEVWKAGRPVDPIAFLGRNP